MRLIVRATVSLLLSLAPWQGAWAATTHGISLFGDLKFEILLFNPQFERIVLPFARNLARMGVIAHVRTADTAQYEKRMENFDFDMAVVSWSEMLSPGTEQRAYWGSRSADAPGSRNELGIKNAVIDQLIEALIRAPDRASLVAHVRALDRVLQYGYYVIPHYHIGVIRVAYWDKYRRPAISPKFATVGYDGANFETWWFDPGAARVVETRKTAVTKQ
jgi:microcin C transport system substrate-binding protein